VIFTIPLLFYLRELGRRTKGRGWIVVVLLTTLVVFWAQFLLTVDQSFEHASMYVVVPIGVLIALWITREYWWDTQSVINRKTTVF
jgi:hypothetical protein